VFTGRSRSSTGYPGCATWPYVRAAPGACAALFNLSVPFDLADAALAELVSAHVCHPRSAELRGRTAADVGQGVSAALQGARQLI